MSNSGKFLLLLIFVFKVIGLPFRSAGGGGGGGGGGRAASRSVSTASAAEKSLNKMNKATKKKDKDGGEISDAENALPLCYWQKDNGFHINFAIVIPDDGDKTSDGRFDKKGLCGRGLLDNMHGIWMAAHSWKCVYGNIESTKGSACATFWTNFGSGQQVEKAYQQMSTINDQHLSASCNKQNAAKCPPGYPDEY